MKLLLLGANGQVGRELRRTLAPLGEVVATSRDGRLFDGTTGEVADLSAPDALPMLLDRVAPDVIVNAAAYTAVDRAEDEPDLAHVVNAEAVGVLGRWAAARDALVVHYSTDYVFDGTQSVPRKEDDPVAPLGVYGASKLAGEEALRASGAHHQLFRTAWVYASHGKNFLRTMLRLAAERDRLSVVDDQHGTPTSAALIAEVTATALGQWSNADAIGRAAREGTFHLVAEGATTWCGFARAIMQRAVETGLLPRAPEVAAITSADFPTRAQRPMWSILDTTHLREVFGVTLPDWRDGLTACLRALQQAKANA